MTTEKVLSVEGEGHRPATSGEALDPSKGDPGAEELEEPVAETVIEARGLKRSFGTLEAVRGLDLDVRKGEIFGFLGPNGAGKSTTIRMLVGLMEPTAGSCRVLGFDLPQQANQLRERLGYMTQKFSLYTDLTVEENLDFAAEIFGIKASQRQARVEATMDEFGLTDRRKQLPAKLSGGWRQRLALAVATIHEPEVLVLDEPTAGVDPDNRRIFWEKLFRMAEGGTTILVSTHYMDEAVRCHRLCVIRHGLRVALASPSELIDWVEPRVLEFQGRPSTKLVRALQTDPAVASVIQLGHRVHVLLEDELGDREVTLQTMVKRIEDQGIEVRGELAEAHLEDALIVLSRGTVFPGTESAATGQTDGVSTNVDATNSHTPSGRKLEEA